jgi:alanine dehydrogenase
VFLKQLLEHFESSFWQQLSLKHVVEDEVHNCKEGAHLLIAELVFFTELVVDVVEVEKEHVHFVNLVSILWSWLSLETEDVTQDLSFVFVSSCLAERLRVILIQLRVEEELI